MRQTSDADLAFMNGEYERLYKEKIALEDENANLTKQLRESQEHVSVLTKKNNELIDKLNREYDKNRDVIRALEIQISNNITLEHKIDMLEKIIKDP